MRTTVLTHERADTDPSVVLFSSPVCRAGVYVCPLDHPRFPQSEATAGYCFAFPRTPVWIRHAGGTPFVADAAVVPLHNAGHPFSRSPISPEGETLDWFNIAPPVLRDLLADRDSRAAEDHLRLFRFDFAPATPSACLTARRLMRSLRAGIALDAAEIEEATIGMLDDLLGATYGCSTRPMPPRHRQLAEAARAYLCVHFADLDGLSVMARELDVSVFHLCRVFRRHTGRTIHAYRTHLRMAQALRILDEGGGDILSAALATGYTSHSHFTSVFGRTFGVRPSSWRLAPVQELDISRA